MTRKFGSRLVQTCLGTWLMMVAGLQPGCDKDRAADPAGAATRESAQSESALATQAEAFGIRLVSLRPTLGGSMLDLRFKVLNPAKALPLFDRAVKPTLFDPGSGTALGMPDDTKLGALRAGLRNPPIVGKLYFVLFENGEGTVKRGSRVTVSLGDCKLENVVVD